MWNPWTRVFMQASQRSCNGTTTERRWLGVDVCAWQVHVYNRSFLLMIITCYALVCAVFAAGASMSCFLVVGTFKSMGMLLQVFIVQFDASDSLTALALGITAGFMGVLSKITWSNISFSLKTWYFFHYLVISRPSRELLISALQFSPDGGNRDSVLFLCLRCGSPRHDYHGCRCVLRTVLRFRHFVNLQPRTVYMYMQMKWNFLGIGYAAMFGPCFTIMGAYFDKKRALANALTVAGASLGQLVIPFIMRYLLDSYGLDNTLFIYGAVQLHGFIAALLLRPPEFYRDLQADPAVWVIF